MEGSQSKEDSVKAICHLYKDGDNNNRCLLSENILTVVYRSRNYDFELSSIKNISFESRKLMFPLILGSVSSAFIIISMLKNLFNPWLSLTLLVISLVIGYFGWSGTNVLTIKEKGHQNDFMLKHISVNMKSFISYVNKILRIRTGQLSFDAMLIYHITTKEHWEEAEKKGEYKHASLQKDGFIHASDRDELITTAELYFKDLPNLVLLAINPEMVTSPIKYELSPERNSLFPHIFGPLNVDAVVKVTPFSKNHQGKFDFPK